jgi:hypothetical protein
MTKQHFEAMAQQFAIMKKGIIDNDSLDMEKKVIAVAVYLDSVKAFCNVAKQFNSRFDADYFDNYIESIVYGDRDINGKKIKMKKGA